MYTRTSTSIRKRWKKWPDSFAARALHQEKIVKPPACRAAFLCLDQWLNSLLKNSFWVAQRFQDKARLFRKGFIP
jgi:hypothetical protein